MSPCVAWAPWDGCEPPAREDTLWFAAALIAIVLLVIWITRSKGTGK